MTFPVIKYFDHQVPKVVHVICNMTVIVFDHLGITEWKGIDRSWMFFDQVLKGPAFTKSMNTMLA